MTKLIIKRSSEFINRFRNIDLYLNEERIGIINNNETKVFEIEAGKHSLRSKIDWYGSKPLIFNIDTNETKEINLTGYKCSTLIILILLISSILYFIFGAADNFQPILFFLLISPFGLYFLYQLTLGKDKYLKLEEG